MKTPPFFIIPLPVFSGQFLFPAGFNRLLLTGQL